MEGPPNLSSCKPVLVVDDDASMRMSIKRLLRAHGFTALLFDSAHALLDHGDCGEAACIIIDINLDDASGIELRRRLAEHGVAAPVIYITGNDSHLNRTAAIESGCIAYLTKPFAAKALIDPIHRAWSTAN
ncbi:response regulator transcription factor [Bradyrhizobium diversitatis]|uniref:response regulator transcription factor n=2 Tax=Bradyrhizobium TaxID=374 RepID=UPI00289C0DE9|nr:response regulator [Bradyrhizobium diversitatis]